MKLTRVCLLLLVLACDGVQPSQGRIQVVTHQLTTTAEITRVTVTVTPANVTQDLTVDPADATKFTGSITVPVGTQTVQADAFAGAKKVGSGTASVTVEKNAQMQAQITILDTTGPIASPDHSPVVTSLVTPAVAQVGDQPNLSATSMDGDGDTMSFSWTGSPSGCGTFASPSLPSTAFTANAIGICTVTFTVTANGKSDSRSASIQISAATGSIDVRVTYVPQPLISSIAIFNGPTQVATVSRLTSSDATIRAAFHKGTPYTVVLGFDRWTTGTVALTDSCAGTIVPPAFVPNADSATATWTPTVDNGACILTATLSRQTLIDTFFVVVLPVP